MSHDRAGAKVTAMSRHTFDQVECDSARMEIAYRLERENGKRPLLCQEKSRVVKKKL